mgnify:CR=1 FL=1
MTVTGNIIPAGEKPEGKAQGAFSSMYLQKVDY